MKKIKLTDDEFKIIFESYKKINITLEYHRNSNQLRMPYDVSGICNHINPYKFTVKQFKQIVDHSFDNFDVLEEFIKCCAVINEEENLRRCIPLSGYEYFLKRLSEKSEEIKKLHLDHVLREVLYFKTYDYENIERLKTKAEQLELLTMKYLDKIPFELSETISTIHSCLRPKGYNYRGYSGVNDFNNWLKSLSTDVEAINPDDFKIEDDIGDYLI